MPFGRPDAAYSEPERFLAAEGVQRAALISMAYLYGTEGFLAREAIARDERALVQAENDYLAECVRASGGRHVGYFGVHPLRPYARAEMERCRVNPHLHGLKLHLPACGVRLDDAVQLARLREVFAWADEHRVPVLVHLVEVGASVSAAYADVFWRELVDPYPNVVLQLAHMGCAGGFGASCEAVLGGFERWRRGVGDDRAKRVFFDLSGAILDEAIDGAEVTDDEACRALGAAVRRIGVDRFLFGSDYPVFSPRRFRASLERRVGWEGSEFARLMGNWSPVFDVLAVE